PATAGWPPRAAGTKAARGSSVVEEGRLALAAQPDVEAVAARAVFSCHQALAAAIDRVENRVAQVVEVHDGLELAHQPRVEQQEVDVRCPPLDGAGLDGLEEIDPIGV